MLSWKRFVSDTWRAYQKNQSEVIRANCDPRQFITTNMMGWFDGFDHYTVSQDLDLAAWDDYVGKGHLDPAENGAAHDLTRGFKRKNFWVMETQPGFVNWAPVNNSLDKGEVRAMAWHDVGHGADTVSYWQWRSALNGQEEYHGTLLGADGTPVPLYSEIQQLGREFAKAGPVLAGTSPKSEVAILHSYDSRWAINWQRHNHDYDPVAEIVSYYKPLRAISQSIDIVPPTAPLGQYKLVVAPGLNVVSEEAAKNLIDYVRQGGHLVLGQRSAMKNDDNGLQPARQPGRWPNCWGAGSSNITRWSTRFRSRGNGARAQPNCGPNCSVPSRTMWKWWSATARATAGWMVSRQPSPARSVKAESPTSACGWMSREWLAAAKWMTEVSGVKPALGAVPDGVEVYPRYGEHGAVYILVNFSKTEQTVSLPWPMMDVLEGGSKQSIVLAVYGLAVLSVERQP